MEIKILVVQLVKRNFQNDLDGHFLLFLLPVRIINHNFASTC